MMWNFFFFFVLQQRTPSSSGFPWTAAASMDGRSSTGDGGTTSRHRSKDVQEGWPWTVARPEIARRSAMDERFVFLCSSTNELQIWSNRWPNFKTRAK
ncbi:hypothetical protein NL676_016123 [Syzygium grande]|nr:hypothetical protein NL676_016123 [Syzygium grande]